MDHVVTVIISVLFSGCVSWLIAWYKANKQKGNALMLKYNDVMDKKYQTLLMYMQCVLDIRNKLFFIFIFSQNELTSSEDYLGALKACYYNVMLFSSENVLRELKRFILRPTQEQFFNTAKAMRTEIWGKDNSLSGDELSLQ